LDEIADIYLSHNKHLNYRADRREEKGPDGIPVTRIEHSIVEHPIRDGESSLAYLHRLYVMYLKKSIQEMKETQENARKTYQSLMGFSSGTNAWIANMVSQGEKLTKMVESTITPRVQFPDSPRIAAVAPPTLPEIEPSPLLSIPERIDFLSGRIAELIAIASSGSKFLVDMNSTQTLIAAELKKSSESNIRFTKLNILIGGLVLLVALVTLFWSYRSSQSASRDQQQLLQQNQQYLGQVQKTLESIDKKSGLTAAASAAPQPPVAQSKAPPKKK
jgi:hypothetical protein